MNTASNFQPSPSPKQSKSEFNEDLKAAIKNTLKVSTDSLKSTARKPKADKGV